MMKIRMKMEICVIHLLKTFIFHQFPFAMCTSTEKDRPNDYLIRNTYSLRKSWTDWMNFVNGRNFISYIIFISFNIEKRIANYSNQQHSCILLWIIAQLTINWCIFFCHIYILIWNIQIPYTQFKAVCSLNSYDSCNQLLPFMKQTVIHEKYR